MKSKASLQKADRVVVYASTVADTVVGMFYSSRLSFIPFKHDLF